MISPPVFYLVLASVTKLFGFSIKGGRAVVSISLFFLGDPITMNIFTPSIFGENGPSKYPKNTIDICRILRFGSFCFCC
ncbi:hypothetical protein PHOSAC3_121034 [Mesotoga infera]|nr:hypothetical protein PHOSAC3_121034 [Mesotoga infera]